MVTEKTQELSDVELTVPWAKYSEALGTYPLLYHLADTALAARALWRVWLRPGLKSLIADALGTCDEDDAELLVALVSATHDLGKANPVFQGQLSMEKSDAVWARDVLQTIDPQFAELRKSAQGLPFKLKPFLSEERAARNVRRHERVSALHFAPEPHNFLNQSAKSAWLSLVVAAHHGRWEFDQGISVTDSLRNGLWKTMRDQLLKKLESHIGKGIEDLPSEMPPHVVILLAGLTIVADRLASMESWYGQGHIARFFENPEEADTTDMSKLLEKMEQHVRETLGVFESPADPVKSFLPNATLNAVQEIMYENSSGELMAVMAPTGAGKTEAALLRHCATQHPERLLFFLPTRATTDAMMRRMEKLFANQSMIASLAHGNATLDDFYAQQSLFGRASTYDETHSSRDKQTQRGLFPADFVARGSNRILAPLCVGTIDQALIGALPLKWVMLRLLALANAHVVIDEVHTMDAYQSALLEPLLKWWSITGTRVTLLSATIPHKQLEKLASCYSLVDDSSGSLAEAGFGSVAQLSAGLSRGIQSMIPANGSSLRQIDGSCKAFHVEPRQFSFSITSISGDTQRLPELVATAHVERALSFLELFPRARVGIFVNRISTAQDIVAELNRRLKADPNWSRTRVVSLHSQMTARDRREKEGELQRLLGRGGAGENLIVVGTQVIEASLDIDLDFITTDLAPAGSLIQRAGRGWRHADSRRDSRLENESGLVLHNLPMSIVAVEDRAFSLPYAPSVLARTLDWLGNTAGVANRGSACGELREIFPRDTLFGVVRQPDDIQDFIDSAWIDFDTLTSDDDLEYAVDQAQSALAAADRRINLEALFRNAATVNSFTKLSYVFTAGEDEIFATRLITRPSARLILREFLEDSDLHYLQHLEAAGRDAGFDWKRIRRILDSVVPTSNPNILRFVKESGAEELQWPPILRGCFIVSVDGSLKYDEAIGLFYESSGES